MADPRRVLLVGGGDLAEEVCEALDAGGGEVKWLVGRRRRVGARGARVGRPDLVCVATRDDAFPLRMALLVRHLDEDVPLLVTIFDPGIAEQIADTVPNCTVTSLADIVAPTLAGPCIDPGPRRGAPQGRARRSASTSGSRRSTCRAQQRAPRAQPRDRRAPPLRPQRRAADLRLRRARADARLRAVRRDDRARPGVRRRVLRLDEVARHGRPEHRRRPRAEVVQGRDRLLGDPHPALGRVLHRRSDQPLRRLEPDGAVRQARGAAARPRDRGRARAGRAAAVHAAAGVRGAGRRGSTPTRTRRRSGWPGGCRSRS